MQNRNLPKALIFFFSLFVFGMQGQVVPSFSVPDTTCISAPISIVNTSSGGTTYYWNFCSGNATANPIAANIGNPGNKLSNPVYMTLVQDGNDCFSFVTNQGYPGFITRNFHGTSFRNNPISSVNMLTTGELDHSVEAIQIKKDDNGNWYGFVNNNTTITRLNFGTSLWNTPTTTDLGPFTNISVAHGSAIVREGSIWLGFFDSAPTANKLSRLNFGTSLANIPTYQDLGNVAGFNWPCQIAVIKENGLNFMLVMNYSPGSLSRVEFGNSLLNAPTGSNLGNCGAIQMPVGVTALNDCETSVGYYTEYQPVPNAAIGRLSFTGGVSGTVTATNLGNTGGFGRPVSFSEIFRQNDSLFAYIPNRDNASLTRLSFAPCNNASPSSSTAFSPPPITYNALGSYHIRLVVNEGMADEASLCKTIYIAPDPIVSLGNDRIICSGTSTLLNAGGGFSSYLWSTGATTSSISVSEPGSYWVHVTKYGCTVGDTLVISNYVETPLSIGPDTAICQGGTYLFNAGTCAGCTFVWSNLTTNQMNIGTGPTYVASTQGNYMVTRIDGHGCIRKDTASLTITPLPDVTTFPLSQQICSGSQTSITLTSTITGANFSWTATLVSGNVTGFSNGTGTSIIQMLTNNGTSDGVVNYAITPFMVTCQGNPVDYIVSIQPLQIVSIVVSSSANPICPGAAITCSSSATNQGVNPSYQWKVNGINQGSNLPTLSFSPSIGDNISCILTSSIACCVQNPVTSNSIVISSFPVPDIQFSTCFDTLITTATKPFKLKGGIPLGGTYSGAGVNTTSGIFTPSTAGVGTKVVTYSYSNSYACMGSLTRSIHVVAPAAFSCGISFTDIRDGSIYPTVKFGAQCWMASNLNFGNRIPYNFHQRDNCVTEKYCYQNLESTCSSFGALYQWDELMRYEPTTNSQGICPSGWHVPDESDWAILFSNYINNGFSGSPLKYSGYSGFNAMLTGSVMSNQVVTFNQFAIHLWASTEIGETKAWSHAMNEYDPSVSYYPSLRSNGFGLRCVKD